MTISRCALRLTVDGQALAADAAALVEARVELGVGGVHDLLHVELGRQSPFVDVTAGTGVELAVGYGEDLDPVFTGLVSGIEHQSGGVRVEALGASVRLSVTRIGRSWRQVQAQDVVSDLLDAGGVDAGEVVAPLSIAAYHVDERRPAWAHLRTLATLAGCELTSDGAGAVNVRPVRTARQSAATLRFGAELLAWAVGGAGAADPPQYAVVPFGAASEQGPDAWHVVLKEPDGGPPSAPTLVPAALRDSDGAAALAQALGATAQRRRAAGRLWCVGDAALRAGDVVSVSGLPTGADAPVRLTAVSHLIGRRSGFRTLLSVEGAA